MPAVIPYLPPTPKNSPTLRTDRPFDDGSLRRRKVAVRLGLTSLAVTAALAATAGRADAASTAKVSGGTLTVHGDGNANAIALSATPDTVRVDVGDDGTSEYAFKPASRSKPAAGTIASRSTTPAASSPTRS